MRAAIRPAFIVAALVGLTLSALAADWSPADRAAFIGACVRNCQAQPGKTEAWCDAACACTADESEKFMTRSDWAEADAAASAGKSTTKLDQIMIASGMCARQSAAP